LPSRWSVTIAQSISSPCAKRSSYTKSTKPKSLTVKRPYFDTISHDYILNVLRSFKLSNREFDLVQRFLKNPRADGVANYTASTFEDPQRGIPQGTSISLFLANVACYELDRERRLILREPPTKTFFMFSSSFE
jgi:retron-type reverse transcriptase